jgi:hypothetical protein
MKKLMIVLGLFFMTFFSCEVILLTGDVYVENYSYSGINVYLSGPSERSGYVYNSGSFTNMLTGSYEFEAVGYNAWGYTTYSYASFYLDTDGHTIYVYDKKKKSTLELKNFGQLVEFIEGNPADYDQKTKDRIEVLLKKLPLKKEMKSVEEVKE